MPVIVQFVNKTPWDITLRDDKGRALFKTFKSGKTMNVDSFSNKMLKRRYECLSWDWKIGVQKDSGEYFNIKLSPEGLYSSPRITFRTKELEKGKTMLFVEGFSYHVYQDSIFIDKYIGSCVFLRKYFWDKRPTFVIASEEEGVYKHPAPLPDVILTKKKARGVGGYGGGGGYGGSGCDGGGGVGGCGDGGGGCGGGGCGGGDE